MTGDKSIFRDPAPPNIIRRKVRCKPTFELRGGLDPGPEARRAALEKFLLTASPIASDAVRLMISELPKKDSKKS
ncbi:hypothetical protein KJ780_03915 [Candidatus Micrarchaeota archaeon]|nr:hypothetical protein [Candidatus Micrarchaeota archaeon]